MIRPFSIALIYGGGKSYEYAKKMKAVIGKEISNSLIIPRLVDGGNGTVWEYIKEVFSEVEYAIVFLSQVYEGTGVKDIKSGELEEKKKTMSTPNLMLEFGYMLNKLDKKDIKIVADFAYSMIDNGEFLFPSDMAGMFVDPKADLVYNDRVEEMILKIWQDVKADLQQRKKIDKNVNVDKLLTRKYMPNIKRVFAKDMADNINSYSLDKQYMKVWDGWIGELKEIDRLQEEDSKAVAASRYKIVYLYERLLLLFIYDKYTKEDGSRVDVEYMGFSDRDIGVAPVYIRLYNTMCRYIFESNDYSATDYIENAEVIVQCLNELDDKESYLGILAKNYAGLCFLNAYAKGADKQPKFLEDAIRYFKNVVKQSEEMSIQGSLDGKILCAYAKFNLARAMAWSGMEYTEYSKMYKQCIKARMDLSKCSELPEFVRLYWLREAYHAENSRIYESTDYWHANNLVKEKEEALDKLNEMDVHLKTLETTKVAQQPFFEKIKSNAEKNYKKLVEGVVE